MKKFGIKAILLFSVCIVCLAALLLMLGSETIRYVLIFSSVFYYVYGFFFFKIIAVDAETMAVTYCFNPFRKKAVFKFGSLKKIRIETVSGKSTIQVIEISFNDGCKKEIACILLSGEQEKLQKIMEGHGVEAVLWP